MEFLHIFSYFLPSLLKAISDKIENHRNYINQIKTNQTIHHSPADGRYEPRPHFTVHRAKKISRLHIRIWGFGEKKMSSSIQAGSIDMNGIGVAVVYQQQQQHNPSHKTRFSNSFKRQHQHVHNNNQRRPCISSSR